MSQSPLKSRAIKLKPIIALVVAFVLASALFPTPNADAQSPRPTEREVVTHNVILSDRIIVEIDTTIDDEVKETRLWVRPHGDNTIPSYSYVEFTQTDHILASAEIDVQSPSYFPPGTIFDVRFEFVATNGEIYTSDTYQIEHIDAVHDWGRVADERLEIIYYGVNDRSIQSLHAQTTSSLPEISSAMGVDDVPQFRAVIFPNVRELTKHGPTISNAATVGHYFGGYAYDEYNLTIMASPSASTLTHELTHLIFGRALDSPYATPAPAWLNEGNASFWETGDRTASVRNFRSIALSRDVPEFAAMNSVPGLRRDINNFYIQSTDFVGYLIENYGRETIGALLSELNASEDIHDAMRAVYGGSLTEIENRWRREWGLPIVTFVEATVDVHESLPPTIPGLPTIVTGTLEKLSERDNPEEVQSASRSSSIEPEPASTPQPQSTVAPQATVAPQPTVVFPTPPPTRVPYFVPGPDDAWPQVKPSAIIVFLVLAAGVAALMYRRLRT